jgi:hypothetical protein
MTKKEAKALTLELWGYLAEHPECECNEDTPPELYEKIKYLSNQSPLCEINEYKAIVVCDKCALARAGAECRRMSSPFMRWLHAPEGEAGNAIRAAAAKETVDIVKAWDTGGIRVCVIRRTRHGTKKTAV